MSIPQLKYELHDSAIVRAEYKESGRLELLINLYEIFYPGSPPIQLLISGIKNKDEVKKFVQELVVDSEAKGEMWVRIDAFSYDDKYESTSGNLHFVLDVAHRKTIGIHCVKITFLTSKGKV